MTRIGYSTTTKQASDQSLETGLGTDARPSDRVISERRLPLCSFCYCLSCLSVHFSCVNAAIRGLSAPRTGFSLFRPPSTPRSFRPCPVARFPSPSLCPPPLPHLHHQLQLQLRNLFSPSPPSPLQRVFFCACSPKFSGKSKAFALLAFFERSPPSPPTSSSRSRFR